MQAVMVEPIASGVFSNNDFDNARRQGDQWTNESVLEAGTRAGDPVSYRHPGAYGAMALSRAEYSDYAR